MNPSLFENCLLVDALDNARGKYFIRSSEVRSESYFRSLIGPEKEFIYASFNGITPRDYINSYLAYEAENKRKFKKLDTNKERRKAVNVHKYSPRYGESLVILIPFSLSREHKISLVGYIVDYLRGMDKLDYMIYEQRRGKGLYLNVWICDRERYKAATKKPKVYESDLYLDPVTKKFCKSDVAGAILKAKAGEFMVDKKGNIRYQKSTVWTKKAENFHKWFKYDWRLREQLKKAFLKINLPKLSMLMFERVNYYCESYVDHKSRCRAINAAQMEIETITAKVIHHEEFLRMSTDYEVQSGRRDPGELVKTRWFRKFKKEIFDHAYYRFKHGKFHDSAGNEICFKDCKLDRLYEEMKKLVNEFTAETIRWLRANNLPIKTQMIGLGE